MTDRKYLPKSLHTVTAVTRVALYIDEMHPVRFSADALAYRALSALGYDRPFLKDDPTVAACIAAVKKANKGEGA